MVGTAQARLCPPYDLHRNSEILNKEFHDGRFAMTVRVDETKRDIVVNRFDAVPHAV